MGELSEPPVPDSELTSVDPSSELLATVPLVLPALESESPVVSVVPSSLLLLLLIFDPPFAESLESLISEGIRGVVGFAVGLHVVVVVDVVVVPKICSQLSASLKQVDGPDLQPTHPVSSM